MTVENNCLNTLVGLPDVLGGFLCNNEGLVVTAQMPDYLAFEQVVKAAKLLSQQRSAASAAVGAVERCEFRYLEYKFFVYYLPEGSLFLLCRPKANAQRIDFEIDLFRDELRTLFAGTPVMAVGKETTPDADSVVDEQGDAPVAKNRAFVWATLLCLVIIVGAGAFMYFSGALSATPQQAPAVAAQTAVPKAAAPQPPAAPEPVAEPVAATVEAEVLLRIAGSATIGSQLAPEIAMAFMQQEMYAGDVRYVKGDMAGTTRVEATLGDGRHVAIEFISGDSASAFNGLKQGQCDIGMSSRPVNAAEMTLLQEIGPMNNPASEHILALDGIAVILHSVNGLDVLSKQQIADIFTGKITDWGSLPQSRLNGPINLYGRGIDSGTGSVFSHLTLADRDFASGITLVGDDNSLAEKVANDTKGIGFVALPYAHKAKAVAIAQQDAASVYPTPFTIATEDYPLARRLYFYTSVNPKNYLTRPFVQFALGDAGQVAARKSGFVELSIDKIKPPVPKSAPEEYVQSIVDASRLSLNFRFRSGSSELDNRGRRDLERLVNYLIRPENRNKSIRLLGFADSRGERRANCYLSQIRAEKVATILQWRGVQTDLVKGFCEDMPIASNATALGRDKNRRVEVWLTE